eukprot:TRINITY_DN7089_c0_g1_i12.p1 TRINITY_DN7089_c0_g1~~TRINITY_DN7089_c0_g1_i12.p1  ORF type:complete len:136 (+),score=1.90 TRINITY_DN7089_c0_g1_i12:632-1039(+)
MVGILVDQRVFACLVENCMPAVWNHLKKMELDLTQVSLQWFICLFSYNLKPEVSDHIWDHLFLSGTKVLFRAGLALISLIKKDVFKCKEFRNLRCYDRGWGIFGRKGATLFHCHQCTHSDHEASKIQVHHQLLHQ